MKYVKENLANVRVDISLALEEGGTHAKPESLNLNLDGLDDSKKWEHNYLQAYQQFMEDNHLDRFIESSRVETFKNTKASSRPEDSESAYASETVLYLSNFLLIHFAEFFYCMTCIGCAACARAYGEGNLATYDHRVRKRVVGFRFFDSSDGSRSGKKNVVGDAVAVRIEDVKVDTKYG